MPFQHFQLEAEFITRPLEQLFSQRDTNILLKIKVLEARYHRYRESPAMLHGKDFTVDTSFLNLILERTATSTAAHLSRNVHAQFSHITLDSLLHHDEHLQLIGSQWN